jgi:hypothetical protein
VAGVESGTWRDVELGAPELARLGAERLTAARVAMLGTLRRDGSARISPIEPYLVEGLLLVGAMSWSAKVADLRRDPRCALHSAITDPDRGEGQLKLFGSAVEAAEGVRAVAADAWWCAWPPEKSVVFCLRPARAVFVEWDLSAGMMTVRRWIRGEGCSKSRRPYP